MRIVVTGLVATYPLGGVSWDYLAYVDGFRRLGHEVLYLEDTGGVVLPPGGQTFSDDAAPQPALSRRGAVAAIGVAGRRAGRCARPTARYHGSMLAGGRSASAASADLFLNVSGSCWLRDEYRGARRTAYLDSDPGYTQAKLWAAERGVRDGRSALLGQPDPAARPLLHLRREHRRPGLPRAALRPRLAADAPADRARALAVSRSTPAGAPLHDRDVVEARTARRR